MYNFRLWLRWTWRDLRARWLQVVAIALIIALGTGVFAGLGGQKIWRIESMDASYDNLNHHDLHLTLASGSFVDAETFQASLDRVGGIALAEVRLVVPTLVDASDGDDVVLTQGALIGVPLQNDGPHINQTFVPEGQGRTLTSEDTGQMVALAEFKFADENGVQPGDTLRISGDAELEIVGAAHQPEYFLIFNQDGGFTLENSFAPLFTSLETAQALTGREGLVNDAVFDLEDGADPDGVIAAIEVELGVTFPDTGFDIVKQEDDVVRELMYADARGDQETWDSIAALFLFGAAFGAFNLAGRIVESQRRQIGISMALGLPRHWIALRPMLVGLQIALLGTLFGLVMGLLLSFAFSSLFETLLPLPYWETSLYLPAFLRAALLGIILPFAATLLPVLRAVRVAPIDAIRTGNLVAKGGGLNSLLHIVPLPGRSFSQMPFRNLLRSPWRSLLTILGISVAVILLTAFVGFLDSFRETIAATEDAILHQSPQRMVASMDRFFPVENGEIGDIRALSDEDGNPLVADVDTALILGGTLIGPEDGDDDDIAVSIELQDFEQSMWVPLLKRGSLAQEGIILSEKAAADLGVGVGDSVTLEHPRSEGPTTFRLVQSEVEVVGIHKSPFRPLTYMDLNNASLMGLEGRTNLLLLMPTEGTSPDDIKLRMLTQPGVTSVAAVQEMADAADETVDIFVQVLAVIQVIVLLMAFLIAFNSTSINVDERVREISTMFAFGLRVRTVTRMQMVENLLVGLLGTALGVALGWLALQYLLVARVEEQLEDLELLVSVSPVTLLLSVSLGVLVVAITPLLSVRRMARMNIPDTLRVME